MRRKNPHPKRAVNARTVFKVVKGRREEEEVEEDEPLVLCLRVPLLNLVLSVLNINAEKLKCIPSSRAIQSFDNANPGSNPLFLK